MAVPGIEIYGNNAATTLAAGINATATSLTVISGTGSAFPAPTAGQFFRFTLNDTLTGLVYEIIYCTSRSGDTFSGLVRGQEGTTAVAWQSADKLFEGVTAGAMANLTQAQQVQQNYYNYSVDTGSVNAYSIALPISLATPVPGALIYWLAANPNTGASTIKINGSGTYPLLGAARLAMTGGEVNRFCVMTYDATLSSYVLLESTGGALQVPTTVAGANQAISLGQAKANFALINGSSTIGFVASSLTTPLISSVGGTAVLTVAATAGVNFVNSNGSAFVVVQGAKGVVSSASNQFVTGAQLQSVYKYGEIKYWWGTSTQAAVTAAWGPGWFLANGTNGTIDLRDRIPIGAGLSYALGAEGGATAVALGAAQLPVHNHVINIGDPGHAHAIADPGHVHGVGDPGHAHGVADPGHVHGWTTGGGGVFVNGSNGIGWYQTTGGNFANMTASATGIGIYASGTGIYLGAAATGIGIYAAGTGIFANSNNAGSGGAFSIMNPYVALTPIFYTGVGA